MRTDTTSSDVIIYQPGPATLNVKTFLHHVMLMGCYVHSTCCVKWFLSARANHHETLSLTANTTQRDQTLYLFPAVPSLFVGVGRILLLSHSPPPSTETIKAMKRPSHWLTTDPWLSFENLRLQIKLSGFKEQRCHSPAPGHSMSPASFEGLMRIFLSCQGRVMGAKENGRAQRSSHSQITRLFEILNCYKRSCTCWNYQIPTRVMFLLL